MSNVYEQAKKLAAKAAAKSKDMRIADKGFSSEPPAEGLARMRLVGYVELGDQVEMYMGSPRVRPKVDLVFELSGKKHPPIELEDGTIVPRRVKVTLTHSLSERATLYKLFQTMNHTGEASHMAQLLGEPFLGRIFHHTFQKDGRDVTIARLKPKGGDYSISPPFQEDVDSGEIKEIKVADPISKPLLFFWETPSMEQWDGLYIEGKWEGNRSKNVVQETIRSAVNWIESPMYALLSETDLDEDDYGPVEPRYHMDDEDAGAPPKKKSRVADEDDEPAPKKAVKKAKPAPVDDDEDEEDEAPPPKAKKAAKPAPVDDDEDEDEEEEPAPPPKKAAKKAAKPAPVDDDEDEDEDEPAPPPKAKKAAKPAPADDDDDDEPAADPRSKRVNALLQSL